MIKIIRSNLSLVHPKLGLSFIILFIVVIGPNFTQAVSPIKPNEIYNSNLVSYYPMNENEGDTVYDQSTNNYDGIITGASWSEGYTGSGLIFDGIDDLVTIESRNILDSQNALTITAWVKLSYDPIITIFHHVKWIWNISTI